MTRPPTASTTSTSVGGNHYNAAVFQMDNAPLSNRPAQSTGDAAEDTSLLHNMSDNSGVSQRKNDDAHVASRLFDHWISEFSDRWIPGGTEFLINNEGVDYVGSFSGKDDSIFSEAAATDAYPPGVSSRHISLHDHRCFEGRKILAERSIQRRIFLILTEPDTSISSFLFFVILVLAIFLSNVLMMLQTMPSFQFKPSDCIICGGSNDYYTNNDDVAYFGPSIPELVNLPIDCECPPAPIPWTVSWQDYTIYFFTVEWLLRVAFFEPPRSSVRAESCRSILKYKMSYLMEWMTILDALATFPYYMERQQKSNGLISLRLLRLFRVFRLLRLGKYNVTFVSLVNVLAESILSFNILLIVLLFGAAFFGSMIYWMERGEWKYTTYTDPPTFAYMRLAADGVSEEPSPFTSIPASFWWFIVTATTVGYGDTYPTSFGGKCITVLAMLMGVLVIAFPVSVFSDLWSKELKKQGVLNQPDSSDMQDDGALKDGCLETEQDPTHKSRSGVVINGTHLNAIRSHLRRIDESQDEIRRILSIYED